MSNPVEFHAPPPAYDSPGVGLPSARVAPTPAPAPAIVIGSVAPQSSPYPVTMNCPHCTEHITTVTTKVLGTTVWIWVAVLSCVFLFTLIPACCIPFLCGSCKDTKHSCPKCARPIGVY